MPHARHDFSGIRESLLPVLAEYQVVIDVHVEYAVRPFDQLRLDAEDVAQLVCQADRLAVIVSRFAPDDLGPHLCLQGYASRCTIGSDYKKHTPPTFSAAAGRAIGGQSPG